MFTLILLTLFGSAITNKTFPTYISFEKWNPEKKHLESFDSDYFA